MVYNIAGGTGVTLNELFESLKRLTGYQGNPVYKDFRPADIKISRADIAKAQKVLGFLPSVTFEEGLRRTVAGTRV